MPTNAHMNPNLIGCCLFNLQSRLCHAHFLLLRRRLGFTFGFSCLHIKN
jgi:hypothetical protein